jgi:predicted DNA-binding transcriptional regulator AlpA
MSEEKLSDKHLTREQAAEFLGVKSGTLAAWYSRGQGPPFRKLGSRLCLYRLSELEEWLTEHTSGGERA